MIYVKDIIEICNGELFSGNVDLECKHFSKDTVKMFCTTAHTCFNTHFRCGHTLSEPGILADAVEYHPLLAVSIQGFGHILQSTAGFGRISSGYDQTDPTETGKFLCACPDAASTGHQFYGHIRIQIHVHSSLLSFIIIAYFPCCAKEKKKSSCVFLLDVA